MEKGLWRKWDGPPTTRFLRHGNSEFNAVTRDRIHTELRKMGLVVPSEDEQVRDSDVSDALWVACTEDLIRRTTVSVAANRYARYLLEAALDRG